ncbi:ParB/Sulfiredoxin [uncultured Caudovirales phage]|uniref:ParB/Sulfiredoxin n=1 Tax=uncultured Caudovirales phage TaxID=2100421 RepID=A0A6J5NB98_9CAUD|nr:ParB/Sulfiredoxin [uncultured Caudovirales phage]
MKANIQTGNIQSMAISSLTAYPTNPRRGDIDAIALSLHAHGQYRPIVVQASTKFVLAGNHTLKAAKKLGWKKIKAVLVDVDEDTAKKIVLADNRLTDLAGYNEPLLKSLLQALPELDGTGFTESEVEALDRLISGEQKEPIASSTNLKDDPEVRIAAWKFTVEQDAYDAWKEQLYEEYGKTKSKANAGIKERLGFPERIVEKPERIEERSDSSPEDVETVSVNEILTHPLNPREGDIGQIIESLSTMGQYRPIVVNKATKHCVSGNHTLQAAVQLGWEKIAVHWIDVDDIEEIKILIVDNRTSDLATYDSGDLNKLLTSTSTKGTGFSREEVAEILSGGKTKPGHNPIGRTNIRVGTHSMRVHTEDLNAWANTIYGWSDIAELLRMPLEACGFEEGS